MTGRVQMGPNWRTPFGANEFLRSTVGLQYESYTFGMNSIPTETIDGTSQKVLQTGEVLAKVTTGDDAGKIGVYQVGALDGRADVANIVGLNNTFLPWTLMERDCEVAAVYHGTAVLAWCYMRDTDGSRIPLTVAVADEMRGKRRLDIMFT